MSNYYIRYKSGECEAVCRELASLGIRVYQPSVYSDVLSVACEVADRSFGNLCRLLRRLIDLGYAFEHPKDVLVEASSDDLAEIDAIESKMGALPIVVRKWYERVKSADFYQQERQLFGKEEPRNCEVAGLGLNTPLVFLSLSKCLLLQDQLAKQAAHHGKAHQFNHFLPLGAWASNSNPKGFGLPSKSFDSEYYDEGAGAVCFVEELREAFKWGGFPLWRRLLTGKKQSQPLRRTPSFEIILPILTDGLSPV